MVKSQENGSPPFSIHDRFESILSMLFVKLYSPRRQKSPHEVFSDLSRTHGFIMPLII